MIKLILCYAILFVFTLTATTAESKQQRSGKAKRTFMLQQPCPSTGQSNGSCKGYVIDHVIPLCAGGADSPTNMQWQTVEEAKLKDKQEWAQCRALKKNASAT